MRTITVSTEVDVVTTADVDVDVELDDIRASLTQSDLIELCGALDPAGIIDAIGHMMWSPSDFELLQRAVDSAVVLGRRRTA